MRFAAKLCPVGGNYAGGNVHPSTHENVSSELLGRTSRNGGQRLADKPGYAPRRQFVAGDIRWHSGSRPHDLLPPDVFADAGRVCGHG